MNHESYLLILKNIKDMDNDENFILITMQHLPFWFNLFSNTFVIKVLHMFNKIILCATNATGY